MREISQKVAYRYPVRTTGKMIDTQLGFIKTADSDKYELAAVILDGKELTQFGVVSYRKSVIMK